MASARRHRQRQRRALSRVFASGRAPTLQATAPQTNVGSPFATRVARAHLRQGNPVVGRLPEQPVDCFPPASSALFSQSTVDVVVSRLRAVLNSEFRVVVSCVSPKRPRLGGKGIRALLSRVFRSTPEELSSTAAVENRCLLDHHPPSLLTPC